MKWQREKQVLPQLIVSSVGRIWKIHKQQASIYPQEIVQGWMNSLRIGITSWIAAIPIWVGIIPNGADMYATQKLCRPIVKLLSQIPDKLDIDKVYRLRFEYMGNRARPTSAPPSSIRI